MNSFNLSPPPGQIRGARRAGDDFGGEEKCKVNITTFLKVSFIKKEVLHEKKRFTNTLKAN